MTMKRKLPLAIAMGIVLFCLFITLVSTAITSGIEADDFSYIAGYIFIMIIGIWACIAFIILSLINIKRIYLLIPILILIAIIEVTSLGFGGDINYGDSSGLDNAGALLSLVIMGALITGLVFALRGKKWGAILLAAIVGLQIYTLFNLFATALVMNGFNGVKFASISLFFTILIIYATIIFTGFICSAKPEEVKVVVENSSSETEESTPIE